MRNDKEENGLYLVIKYEYWSTSDNYCLLPELTVSGCISCSYQSSSTDIYQEMKKDTITLQKTVAITQEEGSFGEIQIIAHHNVVGRFAVNKLPEIMQG